jgi:pimeloyl-ACP methyl ester carboxylesterase
MIAGSVGPELKAIDVPVFLGIAEQDICGPPHKVPAEFPSSHDVTLFVIPAAGHCHHIFPARIALWARLASWVRGLAEARLR